MQNWPPPGLSWGAALPPPLPPCDLSPTQPQPPAPTSPSTCDQRRQGWHHFLNCVPPPSTPSSGRGSQTPERTAVDKAVTLSLWLPPVALPACLPPLSHPLAPTVSDHGGLLSFPFANTPRNHGASPSASAIPRALHALSALLPLTKTRRLPFPGNPWAVIRRWVLCSSLSPEAGHRPWHQEGS